MGGPGSGRGGLSIDVVCRAEKLLEAGWGPYRVARTLELGITTVYRIKAGAHFLQLAMDELVAVRCQGCGGLVLELPCRLCAMRAAGL
jgi:hypothetical protein